MPEPSERHVIWDVATFRFIPHPPDFDQIATRLAEATSVLSEHGRFALLREELRQVWNARGAAAIAVTFSAKPPCATFSPSEYDPGGCKHCGWTQDAHREAEAIRTLDR